MVRFFSVYFLLLGSFLHLGHLGASVSEKQNADRVSPNLLEYVPVVSGFSKEDLSFLEKSLKRDIKKHIDGLLKLSANQATVDGLSIFIEPGISQSAQGLKGLAKTLSKTLPKLEGIKHLSLINVRADLVHEFLHAFKHPGLESLDIRAVNTKRGPLNPERVAKKTRQASDNLPNLKTFNVKESEPLEAPRKDLLLKFKNS